MIKIRGDFLEIRYGYCKCGCNQKTTIATKNHTKNGYIRGEPMEFLKGHRLGLGKNNHMQGKIGKDHPSWKGGRKLVGVDGYKYIRVYRPEHHRSDCQGYVLEHILVAEKALRKSLPVGAVVHHIDGNGLNNNNNNLIVCQDQSYHMTLHAKQRRLENG